MDVRAVLVDVAGLGPFFTVGVEPVPKGSGWRPVAELYADPEPLRVRIAQVRRALDTDDRVAASITFQGVAALLLSSPLAAVVLHGTLPRLAARDLYWRPAEGGPWALRCPAPVGLALPGTVEAADALAAFLLEEHLVPLVAAVRRQVRVAERLLWGNAASSVAAGKRLLGVERPAVAGRAAAVAERVLATGPLAGTGRRLPAQDPDRDWTFRRRSCCLYYLAPGGDLCGDCVLHDRR